MASKNSFMNLIRYAFSQTVDEIKSILMKALTPANLFYAVSWWNTMAVMFVIEEVVEHHIGEDMDLLFLFFFFFCRVFVCWCGSRLGAKVSELTYWSLSSGLLMWIPFAGLAPIRILDLILIPWVRQFHLYWCRCTLI